MKKVRLDQRVFELGFTESRERAKTTVMSGIVFVNGQRADKPGMPVDPDADIEVRGVALPFVSRGGFKLDKALKVFPIDRRARPALTAVLRPADLRTYFCSTARRRSMPLTSATGSSRGSSGMTSAS